MTAGRTASSPLSCAVNNNFSSLTKNGRYLITFSVDGSIASYTGTFSFGNAIMGSSHGISVEIINFYVASGVLTPMSIPGGLRFVSKSNRPFPPLPSLISLVVQNAYCISAVTLRVAFVVP